MIITVTLNGSVDRTIEVEHMKLGALLTGRLRVSAAAGKGVNVSNILAQQDVPSVITGFAGKREMHYFERLETETKGRITCRMVPIG